jgi:hypothetical protein
LSSIPTSLTHILYIFVCQLQSFHHIDYSKQQCFKLLPYAGGLVAILLICFGLWVRSVPPRRIKQIQTPGLDIDPEMIKAQMEFERQMQEQQVPPQGENVDAVKQENAAEEHNLDAEDNTQQQQHHHESETQEEPAGGEENDQEPQREEDTPQGEL